MQMNPYIEQIGMKIDPINLEEINIVFRSDSIYL